MEGPAQPEDDRERGPKRRKRARSTLEATAVPHAQGSHSLLVSSAALQRAVPISPEGVRAFVEPAAFSRAEGLLAPTSEAPADHEAAGSATALSFQRDVDGRSLRLSGCFPDGATVTASIQRRDGDAAAGGGLLCTAATCTVKACRESLGLCPHAAACLLYLAARPELFNLDEQVPDCPPSPALVRFNQLGDGSAGRAILAELAAFDRTRQPIWRCTVQGCKSRKEESCIPRGSVMKTLRPHANVARDGEYVMINLQPVLGAPPFDRPAFYSRLCGHQLREEDKWLDGGDPSCFLRLLKRVNAFAQQLRAAGQLQPATDAVLWLAESLWQYAGDGTFLQADQSSDSTQQQKIKEARGCLVETCASLCFMAIDDRLSQEARTALRDRAWSAACALLGTEPPPQMRPGDAAFFSAQSLFDHEGPITLWYSDFDSHAPVLLCAARVLVRVTRMAGDLDPPSLSVLVAASSSRPLLWSPPSRFLDYQACCRYLLERGRLQECHDLSRSIGDVDILAAAAQRLSRRPEDAVSAVLELVDRMLSVFFVNETGIHQEHCNESRLSFLSQMLCISVNDRSQTFYKCKASPAHSFLTVCDACRTLIHYAVAFREAYVALVRGLESLREQRAAASDHLSCVWLGVALMPFIGIRSGLHSRLPSAKRDDVLRSVVCGGLALAPSPSSFARESAEALRIAKLPLAQAYAACAERPREALEAALIRLATIGLLPSQSCELRSLLESKTAPQECPAAGDASILAARFCLHNANRALHSVYTSYSKPLKSKPLAGLNRDLPSIKTAELGSLYKVGNELFGPVDVNVDDPSRVREVAISLLAARTGSGRVLSALGECEPLQAQSYEPLLVACVLRLTALARLDDVLWLIVALLELDDGGDTAARRQFCAAVLFHRDFLYARDQLTKEEYDEALHAPLIAAASTSALQLHLFADGALAWKLAVRHARALDLYRAAFEVLSMCGDLVEASAVKSIFAGQPDPDREHEAAQPMGEVLAAAEAVVAASRSHDGFRAHLFLSLLAATGDALSQPPSDRDQSLVWTFLITDPDRYRERAGYAGYRDRLFHSAVCLEASGRLEAAASLAVACLFRYNFDHEVFAESLNMLDRIAPRLDDVIGLPAQAVAAQGRRRLIEHCLARYEEPPEDTELRGSAFELDARLQQYIPLLQRFVEWGNRRDQLSPFVDYYLAAKIASAFLRPKAVRAYIRKRTSLDDLKLLRLVLNEIADRLRRGGSTEEERAGALQFAELVWDACPCVQAVYVIRGVHSAAGEGSGGRWGGWLEEQLREIQQNTALALTKNDEDENHDEEGAESVRNDSNPDADHERVVLAAVALFLADEEDGFGVEKALGLDFSARPAGVVSMMTLFAHWCLVAKRADMDSDHWNASDDGDIDCWYGAATLERAAARLDLLPGRAGLLLQQLFADAGPGPAGRDALAVEDDEVNVEGLEETCNNVLEHQDEYFRQLGLGMYSRANGCGQPKDCALCTGAWRHGGFPWRLHSMRLLAPPLLRLFVDAFLRVPGMDRERGQALYPALRDAAAAYVVGRLTTLSRIASTLSCEVASATAHKIYLATKTFCEELRMTLDLPETEDLDVARHPALAHLRGLRLPICEAFLLPDADPDADADSGSDPEADPESDGEEAEADAEEG